ncbi:hypothetical protein C8R43DRAFT_1236192 [Mycena crocata]|nr:hypothetical protein C8R43DRAFT_1236192 [Mycena crocata]
MISAAAASISPQTTNTNMGSNWILFITASRASTKALNRALVLMQDYEYSDTPADSLPFLLTSENLPNTPQPPTTLPLSDTDVSSNDFAGMSLADINAFVRSHEEQLRTIKLSGSDWLVIDQRGLATSTCFVCERFYDFGDEREGAGHTSEFRACRIPYEHSWLMITNLDIANMGFEEFVDEDAGQEEDGSWRWRSMGRTGTGEELPQEMVKRAAALQALRDAGHAD